MATGDYYLDGMGGIYVEIGGERKLIEPTPATAPYSTWQPKLPSRVTSAHRSPVKSGDGCWTCSDCGAESMDLEMFEDAAEWMECPGPVEDLTEMVRSDKLTRQVQGAREALKKLKFSAEKAGSSFDGLAAAMQEMAKSGADIEVSRVPSGQWTVRKISVE